MLQVFLLLGNLHSDYVDISICNFIFCKICTGGNRELLLSGTPGWNYIICGEIGDTVKMTFQDNVNRTFAFCEVAPFGITGSKKRSPRLKFSVYLTGKFLVAPTGKIVLTNVEARIDGIDESESVILVDDDDDIDPGQCFKWNKQGENIHLFVQKDKYVSHVQILSSQEAETGKTFKNVLSSNLAIFKVLKFSVFTFCRFSRQLF